MKRLLLIMLVLASGLIAGCSIFGGINSSLDYVNAATSYIHDAAKFSEQLPALAEQAILDPAARDELVSSFESLKKDIIAFNGLEAPAFAKEIHRELVAYNDTLLAQVNTYLEQFETNVIDLEALKQSPIVQTIDKITQTLVQIQQLGQ